MSGKLEMQDRMCDWCVCVCVSLWKRVKKNQRLGLIDSTRLKVCVRSPILLYTLFGFCDNSFSNDLVLFFKGA